MMTVKICLATTDEEEKRVSNLFREYLKFESDNLPNFTKSTQPRPKTRINSFIAKKMVRMLDALGGGK